MTTQLQHPSNAHEWDDRDDDYVPVVNPATGLPMVDNRIGSIDVGGSPYGQDIHHAPWTPPIGSGFD